MHSIGVDVGGTHTDLVLFDHQRGALHVLKTATTRDPADGTVDSLVKLAGEAGIAPDDISHFMHGTTVATNIALQHNGARTGLITTAGFRDILHIARHKRPQTFSLQLDLPWQKHPLVPRRWRMTVPERIVPPGDVHLPLDEDAVRRAARHLRDEGVEAIAICFLHAYLNPVHEIRAGEIVAEEAPETFVSLSHAVVPQYREYERFSTTALNAYVGPRTGRYLRSMVRSLEDRDVTAKIHLMQSSGGAATLEAAETRPVNLLMSGPAAGLIGGMWIGKSAGFDNVITLDVGGTSADIGVAPNGELLFKHILDTRLGDYNAMVPMAELDAIGAGGGSIAYIDAGGQFQVGPRSAGAEPGPCCYGRGGVEPTATDCLLALGWIDPDNFLGGRTKLDSGLARAAIVDRLAAKLTLSVEEAASGALRILTHSMVQACEINSVRRGYDPRDFALVAFGGAGPLFGCSIAREMSIPRVIVPPQPGLTSALGLLVTDVSYEQSRTVMLRTDQSDQERLRDAFGVLESEISAQLARDGYGPGDVSITRFADCRYVGQGYELRTPAPGAPDGEVQLGDIRRSFDAAHAQQYGRSFPDKAVQVVNVRVAGSGQTTKLKARTIDAADGPDPGEAMIRMSDVVFDVDDRATTLNTPRYDRAALRAGHAITGPAIIDQMDTTTVVPPDFTGVVDQYGNLVLSRKGSQA